MWERSWEGFTRGSAGRGADCVGVTEPEVDTADSPRAREAMEWVVGDCSGGSFDPVLERRPRRQWWTGR